MLFNSIEFLLFLPVAFILFQVTPEQYRWLILLISSLVFYLWLGDIGIGAALLITTVSTYGFGLLIVGEQRARKKKWYLALSILLNLATLIVMKYIPFMMDSFGRFAQAATGNNPFRVPASLVSIGVSFYVMQAISYLVDVYYDATKPEKHFGYFALSLCFFPKILQGPIERTGNLLLQLKKKSSFDAENCRDGLIRFAFGLAKKIIVADRLGIIAGTAFDVSSKQTGVVLALGIYAFYLQLYFDFSAYMDMAIGTAKLFNVNLTENFNHPLTATSIPDFWRRWHISLSQWLQDYLFKPLNFRLRNTGILGTVVSLGVVFLICGFWHGANWTFILWGVIHGVYMIAAFLFGKLRRGSKKKARSPSSTFSKAVKTIITFNALCFGWIFFRAPSISDALHILRRLFSFSPIQSHVTIPSLVTSGLFQVFGLSKTDMLILVLSLLCIAAARVIEKRIGQSFNAFIQSKVPIVRWIFYACFIICMEFSANNTSGQFLYFQF